jgi:hypothetical protein
MGRRRSCLLPLPAARKLESCWPSASQSAFRGPTKQDLTLYSHQTTCSRTLTNTSQLMLACKSGSGTHHLIPTLILHGPSILQNADKDGNTALHHASAAGELKALRLLLQYGANPLANNAFQWTPLHYSATPAAEAYFKTLIIEVEKKKAEGKREQRERDRQRTAGVRLVTDQDTLGNGGGGEGRVSSERQRARDDAQIAGLPAPGMEWSPIEQKRKAMTPTEGRGWTFTPDGMRPRAETGGSI